MSGTWDPYSSEREYMVSVELYVSSNASSALRKVSSFPLDRGNEPGLPDEMLKPSLNSRLPFEKDQRNANRVRPSWTTTSSEVGSTGVPLH
jgi:hypothetical protein